MDSDVSTRVYVAVTASRSRRAAGELQQWAVNPDARPRLAVTLAHVEDRHERLASGLQLMADSVEDWCLEDKKVAGADGLTPEARALRHWLGALADTLIDARDAWPAISEWTRGFSAKPPPNTRRPIGADGCGRKQIRAWPCERERSCFATAAGRREEVSAPRFRSRCRARRPLKRSRARALHDTDAVRGDVGWR
jgi:hypothetical protein